MHTIKNLLTHFIAGMDPFFIYILLFMIMIITKCRIVQ